VIFSQKNFITGTPYGLKNSFPAWPLSQREYLFDLSMLQKKLNETTFTKLQANP